MPGSLIPPTFPDGLPILVAQGAATACLRLVATRADTEATWLQYDVSQNQPSLRWQATLARNLGNPWMLIASML